MCKAVSWIAVVMADASYEGYGYAWPTQEDVIETTPLNHPPYAPSSLDHSNQNESEARL